MSTGFDLEEFPTSESAKRQLSYVTKGFYDTSYIGKWIYQVMGLEYDEAKRIVEELPLQFFPETATWGLKYHEISFPYGKIYHMRNEEGSFIKSGMPKRQ